MEGPSGLLVQLEHREVLHIVRQVLKEGFVLCRRLEGDKAQGKG